MKTGGGFVFIQGLLMIAMIWITFHQCEKQLEEHNWRCVNMVIVQNQHQAVSDTIRNTVYHSNMSHEELNIFIALSTYQTMQIHDGDTTLITSSIETCGETICPE